MTRVGRRLTAARRVRDFAGGIAVAAASECETETVQAWPHRISWARLLKRVSCPDAASTTRQQAQDNCARNRRTRPHIRIECVYEGQPLSP